MTESTRTPVLSHFRGDGAFLRELVRMFREDCAKLMADVRDAIDRRDADGLRRAAHTLHGSIGYFDTGAAYQAAARLEALGRAGSFAAAAAAYAELDEAVGRLQPSLAALAGSAGDGEK